MFYLKMCCDDNQNPHIVTHNRMLITFLFWRWSFRISVCTLNFSWGFHAINLTRPPSHPPTAFSIRHSLIIFLWDATSHKRHQNLYQKNEPANATLYWISGSRSEWELIICFTRFVCLLLDRMCHTANGCCNLYVTFVSLKATPTLLCYGGGVTVSMSHRDNDSGDLLYQYQRIRRVRRTGWPPRNCNLSFEKVGSPLDAVVGRNKNSVA
jgi:hypothetical protein